MFSDDFESPDIDEDQDSLEINELLDQLEQEGYQCLNELDYDELEALAKRESDFSEEYLNMYREAIHGSIVDAINAFKTSKASVYKVDSSKISGKFKAITKPSFMNPLLNSAITKFNFIDDERDVDKIIQGFLEREIIKPDIYNNNYEELYNYIKTYRDTVLAHEEKDERHFKRISEQREYVSALLLPKYDSAERFYNNPNIKHIKQVYKDSSGYYYYCPKCDKYCRIEDTPFTYTIFPIEVGENTSTLFYFNGIKCDCGERYVLHPDDISAVANFFYKYVKRKSKSIADALENMSKGTSLFTQEVPLSYLEDAFPVGVLVSKDISDTKEPNTVKEDNTVVELKKSITNEEYLAAVKEFYEYLDIKDLNKGYVKPKVDIYGDYSEEDSELLAAEETSEYLYEMNSSDNLTYKELAVFISASLSKNYNVLKNQAIFTLLSSIEESPVMSSLFNYSELWDVRNQLQVLQNLNSSTKPLKLEVFNALYDCYYSMEPNGVSLQEFKEDKAKSKEVLEYLLDKKEVLEQRCKSLEELYHNSITYVRDNIDLISYTKLININQYDLYKLSLIINNKELFKLFDEISDRVIVYNLAESFARIFVQKNANFKKVMDKLNSNKVEVVSSKSTRDNISRAFQDYSPNLLDYFSWITKDLTANQLEPLKRLKTDFDSGKIYEFLCGAFKLEDPTTTLVSENADMQLASFKVAVNEFVKKLKDEDSLLFDGSDLDKAVFYYRDFLKEELEDNLDAVRYYPGKYVLRRISGESFRDYMDRFKEMQNEGLNSYNSYNVYDSIKPLEKYFVFIENSCNVYDQKYNAYGRTMGMISILNICANALSKNGSLEVLKLTKTNLNILLSKVDRYDYDFDFKIFEFNYRMLNGDYIDYINSKITRDIDLYKSITIPANSLLTDLFDSYYFLDTVVECLNEVDAQTASDNDDILDREDIKNSLYMYASYYPEFLKRF